MPWKQGLVQCPGARAGTKHRARRLAPPRIRVSNASVSRRSLAATYPMGDASSATGLDASDSDGDDSMSLAGGSGRLGSAASVYNMAGSGTAGSVGDPGDRGGRSGWESRGDKAARDRAHRRARAELKRYTSARKFPLQVGVVMIHSLGKVRWFMALSMICRSCLFGPFLRSLSRKVCFR